MKEVKLMLNLGLEVINIWRMMQLFLTPMAAV